MSKRTGNLYHEQSDHCSFISNLRWYCLPPKGVIECAFMSHAPCWSDMPYLCPFFPQCKIALPRVYVCLDTKFFFLICSQWNICCVLLWDMSKRAFLFQKFYNVFLLVNNLCPQFKLRTKAKNLYKLYLVLLLVGKFGKCVFCVMYFLECLIWFGLDLFFISCHMCNSLFHRDLTAYFRETGWFCCTAFRDLSLLHYFGKLLFLLMCQNLFVKSLKYWNLFFALLWSCMCTLYFNSRQLLAGWFFFLLFFLPSFLTEPKMKKHANSALVTYLLWRKLIGKIIRIMWIWRHFKNILITCSIKTNHSGL